MINNYYDEIKNELINNEAYKRVKDYSKSKNGFNIYHNECKVFKCSKNKTNCCTNKTENIVLLQEKCKKQITKRETITITIK